jgi:DNA-binding transcriptional LysR family regulator
MAGELDASLLKTFLACARLGSMGRASASLGRTQPAVSLQVRRLEDIVGEDLFYRATKGIALTDAGAALVPYAERILSLSSEALAILPRSRISGRCRIGIIADLLGVDFSELLSDFSQRHPGTSLEILTLPMAEFEPMLAAGQIQLALCDVEHMEVAPLEKWDLPMIWVAGDQFDTASDPLPLVAFSAPCRWRRLAEQALERGGRASKIAFESGNLIALQAAVRAGLGVTASLRTAIMHGVNAVAANSNLPSLPPTPVGLYRGSETEGDPLVDTVEALLRELVKRAA